MRIHVVGLVLVLVCAHQGAGAENEAPTAEQIRDWVSDLSAERYSKRTSATKNLIAAGQATVQPLMEGIAEHGLEVTTRGIYVLQQLAVAGDEATEDAARKSLEKIAAARVTAAARHARDALAKLDSLRQQRALTELARLGAVVDRKHEELALPFNFVFNVEINSDWQGQVEDLRWLKFLHDVEQVTFVGPRVEDRWLTFVEGMPNVIIFKIKRANITDDGLAPLKTLPRLQYIKLLYVPIGDGTVRDLAECQRAMRIDIFGSRMTRDGEAKLRESVAAKVDRRKGAFMGISPTTADNEMWEIQTVTRGSSAEKAGLRPGDSFVTYDGKPVGDFRSLTSLIAENDVGETVTVKIRRGGQIIERRITLGEWH
jgi:hypothetical protein